MPRNSHLLFLMIIQSILVSCAFYPDWQLLSLFGLSWFLATMHSLKDRKKILPYYVSGFNFLILAISFHWVGFAISEYYALNTFIGFLILTTIYLLACLVLYFPLSFATLYLNSILSEKEQSKSLLVSFVLLNVALVITLPIPPLYLGYGFISSHFKGFFLVSFIGVKGLTILFWLVSLVLAFLIISKRFLYAFMTLLALLSLHILGNLSLSTIQTKRHAVSPLTIHLLQPNIANQLKRHDISGASMAFEIMGKNYEMIDKIINAQTLNSANSIFVLPETAIPYYFPTDSYYFDSLKKYLGDSKIALLTGGYWKTANSHHNSAFFFNEVDRLPFTEQSVYHKQILLPFGEYIPFKDLIPGLKSIHFEIPEFNPGKNGQLWRFHNFNFSPLICYEILFDSLWLKTKNTDFIYNPTNDAWFGPSIQQYQHLVVVWTKSLEFGIPVLRAANSGYSAWITPLEINNRSNLGQESIQTFSINSTFARSFYFDYYNFIRFINIIFLTFFVCFVFYQKSSLVRKTSLK